MIVGADVSIKSYFLIQIFREKEITFFYDFSVTRILFALTLPSSPSLYVRGFKPGYRDTLWCHEKCYGCHKVSHFSYFNAYFKQRYFEIALKRIPRDKKVENHCSTLFPIKFNIKQRGTPNIKKRTLT